MNVKSSVALFSEGHQNCSSVLNLVIDCTIHVNCVMFSVLKMDGQLLRLGQFHLESGKEQLSTGTWQEAISSFICVQQSGDALLNLIVGENGVQHIAYSKLSSAAVMVEVLTQTGRHLNTLSASAQAASCFYTALSLATFCTEDINPWSSVTIAFKCLVTTYIHLQDHAAAATVLSQFRGLLVRDGQRESLDCLALTWLELGKAQVEITLCGAAVESLQQARTLLMHLDPSGSLRMATTLSTLGYCYLGTLDPRASECLAQALHLWRALQWPLDQTQTILNCMKHYLEAQFREKWFDNDQEVCSDMLQLHQLMHKYGLGMEVADAFTYLGTVAFHKENERKATAYFERALSLYKQAPLTEEHKEEMRKLLRFIGVACYNSRDFHKAARSYQECLQMLEHGHATNLSKAGQIADCCASLGFTYSRLRDFDNMLKYYERALQLESSLAPEDLQLIETNIGSLYHVRAVKHKQCGDTEQANSFFHAAESAFNRALRYSWKSFPYINYGYYLLCRGQHSEAASVLQQGYLNSVIDKDTVEFDHTEDPILIEDLQLELAGREDIRMPAVIIALYLKVLAQVGMGNLLGAGQTATQLHSEVNSCRYDSYYIEGYGEQRMKALSFSLLGYAYRAASWQTQARDAFQTALATLPGYSAALHNLRTMKHTPDCSTESMSSPE